MRYYSGPKIHSPIDLSTWVHRFFVSVGFYLIHASLIIRASRPRWHLCAQNGLRQTLFCPSSTFHLNGSASQWPEVLRIRYAAICYMLYAIRCMPWRTMHNMVTWLLLLRFPFHSAGDWWCFYMGKREKLQTKAATATDAPYKGSMQRFKLKALFSPCDSLLFFSFFCFFFFRFCWLMQPALASQCVCFIYVVWGFLFFVF